MIPRGLLPDELEGYAWIAGGYAACPPLASDMDIWVLCGDLTRDVLGSLDTYHALILKHLTDAGHDITMEDENTKTADYEGYRINIHKVARVEGAMSYHIMVTDAIDIMQVLDGFDISTHQVAIGPDGEIVRGRDFTNVRSWPQMLLNTPHTQERFEKITKRFGHWIIPVEADAWL